MSEAPTPALAASDPAPAPAAERNGQLIVSLSIVGAMAAIAVGLMITHVLTKDAAILGGVFTIVGALATALNAPTGITNAIKAMRQDPGPGQ